MVKNQMTVHKISIFCRFRFVRKIYVNKDNSWRKEVMLLTLKVRLVLSYSRNDCHGAMTFVYLNVV